MSILKVAAAASLSPLNVANPPSWNTIGYYWLHGFKMKVRHTNDNCTAKKLGYKVDATHADTKDGGSATKDGCIDKNWGERLIIV